MLGFFAMFHFPAVRRAQICKRPAWQKEEIRQEDGWGNANARTHGSEILFGVVWFSGNGWTGLSPLFFQHYTTELLNSQLWLVRICIECQNNITHNDKPFKTHLVQRCCLHRWPAEIAPECAAQAGRTHPLCSPLRPAGPRCTDWNKPAGRARLWRKKTEE